MSSLDDTVSELSSIDDSVAEFKKDEANFRKAFKNFREANCEMQSVFKEFRGFAERTQKLEAEFKFLGHIHDFLRTDDPSKFIPVIREREDGPHLSEEWWSHFSYAPSSESIDSINRIGDRIEKLLGTFVQDSDDSDYFSDLGSQSSPPGDNSLNESEETYGGSKWKFKLEDMKQRGRSNKPPSVRMNQLTAARLEYLQEKRCKGSAYDQKRIRLPRMDICDNMPQEDITESLLDAIEPVRLSSNDDIFTPLQDDFFKSLGVMEKEVNSETMDAVVSDDCAMLSTPTWDSPKPKSCCSKTLNHVIAGSKEKEMKGLPMQPVNNFHRSNSAKSSTSSVTYRTPCSTPDSLHHELVGGRFSPLATQKTRENSSRSSPALSPRRVCFAPDINFKKGYLHCPKARRRKGTNKEEKLVMWSQSEMESVLGYP